MYINEQVTRCDVGFKRIVSQREDVMCAPRHVLDLSLYIYLHNLYKILRIY